MQSFADFIGRISVQDSPSALQRSGQVEVQEDVRRGDTALESIAGTMHGKVERVKE
jgi:hypothetical protein